MLTTTLKDIRAKSPCTDGWEKLLKHLDKTGAEAKDDETPLSVLTVLESNGMDDALWVLDNCVNSRICVLFACDCAESALHIFEKERPNDARPREAIKTARNPNSTEEEMAAARDAARDAAWAARDAWAAQEKRLIQYLEHDEAAADMPWEPIQ